jgi:tetratricopeptide (TPR) repeat protein
MATDVRPMEDRRGGAYTPAVGPRLRPLLWACLGGFALLVANGAYLAAVTALTWWLGTTQQTYFYFLMVVLHLVLGLALIVPFLAFGLAHLATSWRRPNRAAVRYGLALLVCSLAILASGLVLVRLDVFTVRDPSARAAGYWVHVLAPIAAVGLYAKHRLAGPRIRWGWARAVGGVVAVAVAAMGLLHAHDPRASGARGPKEGRRYFFPSEATTASGKFIPASTLMMDDYCLKCHQDAYRGWFHSSHHFSSFNNPAYLFSVRETRRVALARDGDARAARWCAGCHDPVPFFSGEFDDPNYDDVNAETSQAGITCTSCHAITSIDSTRGNADYTIEEPQHYPFAASEDPLLQWVNNALVRAKPEMHRKTFLKPAIRDSRFCSACHKVGLPYALNHDKDFIRGQNHYDTFLLSGASGRGARSFYYPEAAKGECTACHMGPIPSRDFGARDLDGRVGTEIHDHFFVGANTGLAAIRGRPDVAAIHEKFLKDGKVRVDLFAIREGGTIDGALLGPLRPEVPALRPGGRYLVEVVVRTLGLGHPLTQGTADSNEVWVELVARSGDRVIGRSGGMGDDGTVDPFSHFINIYMLDRHGKRIDRRNPQDIFVPLYDKQVPPGAAQVVHFGLDVPDGVPGPITFEARVNYRKFDRTYMDHVFGKGQGPALPVVVMASDRVTIPIEGGPGAENDPSPIKDAWQRWNDYGIGLLLEGGEKGGQKGELRQAEPAFRTVADLGRSDGWVNLARVYLREGRIPEAREALAKAAAHPEPAAPWVITWLSGQVDERNGLLAEAIRSYETVLATKVPDRGFDFSSDYVVLNALGAALYARSRGAEGRPARLTFLGRAAASYRRTVAIDSENVAAHYGLAQVYRELGRDDTAIAFDPDECDPNIIPPASWSRAIERAADRRIEAGSRLRAIHGLLVHGVEKIVMGNAPGFDSRLEPLHELVEALGPAIEAEPDAELRAALARLLEHTHRSLHAMLKPDETAEGRAVASARRDNPAADQNAQAIVIHSLHRPGAPGMGREESEE